MKGLVKIGVLLVAFTCMAITAQAQKFGYINSQAILAEMPEVLQAQTNLETLQKQLTQKGQNMLTNLQAKFADIQQKVERGELSPMQQEEEGKKLRAEEAKIAEFEQDMIKNIKEKEATLLQPILNRVNDAIKDVAEENSYTFIFDASTQVLLYAQENTDVSALVKAKLGL